MIQLNHRALFHNSIKDIGIKSPATFQAVALFVDKPRYIEWMIEQRKKLEIKKPNEKDVEWPYWQWKLDDPANKEKMDQLLKDAKLISIELKAPILMKAYIIQTIFNGRIWKEYNLVDKVGPNFNYPEVRMAIIPDFTTTVDEVKEAFRVIKEEYKQLGDYLGVTHHKRYIRDHFTNYRKWYWKRMVKISSKQIAKTHLKQTKEKLTLEEIQTGIKTYRQWLKE